jgi:hypothetical protein
MRKLARILLDDLSHPQALPMNGMVLPSIAGVAHVD